MNIKTAFFNKFAKICAVFCAVCALSLPAVAANLPAGYSELEYISTNHDAYFMTDLTVNDFDRVTAQIKLYDNNTENSSSNYPHLFGVSASGTSGGVQAKVFRFYNQNNSAMYAAYNDKWSSSWGGTWVPQSVPLGIWHDFDIKLASGEQYIKMDNNVVASGTLTATLENPYKLPIFAMSYAGNVEYTPHLDSKTIKFYLNGNLVRNFVPARHNIDGLVGMYDTVQNKFYTSAVSETPFTAGPSTVNHCRNLFDEEGPLNVHKNSYTNGQFPGADNVVATRGTYFMAVKPNTKYTISMKTTGDRLYVFGHNSVVNPDDYTTSNRITFNRVIGGTSSDIPKKYTFETNSTEQMVAIYYANNALPTEFQVEEGETATNYVPFCKVKVATKAYNDARFEPVQTELDSAVTSIKTIVSDTIAQTSAISTLAQEKQTRPNTECPAYRQCLLISDNQGNPHWYEINDAFYNLFKPAIQHTISATGTTSQNAVPSTYQQLEYIESDGTQYIDTGFKANLNTKVELDSQLVSYTDNQIGYILGSRTGQSQNAFVIGTNDGKISASSSKYFAQFDSVSVTVVVTKSIDLEKHKLTLSSAGFYIDNELIRTYSNPSSFTTQENIPLFAYYSAGTLIKGVLRAYSFKMWNGDTLQRDLVPVKRISDNVVGMYDLATGDFLYDVAGGNFTAGPNVQNQTTEWTANFAANATYSYGQNTVYGTAKCNATTGTENTIATATQMSNANWSATGTNCWCSLTKVEEPSTGNVAKSNGKKWVWLAVPANQTCAGNCSENCADAVANGTNSAFRTAISGVE